jgi:hypothetical protein
MSRTAPIGGTVSQPSKISFTNMSSPEFGIECAAMVVICILDSLNIVSANVGTESLRSRCLTQPQIDHLEIAKKAKESANTDLAIVIVGKYKSWVAL